MRIEKRASGIIRRLKKHYFYVKKTALKFSNPLEILVATILSAQCTDKRVNKVTPGIFKKYRFLKDYAAADIKVFEQKIRSTGFYHNKTKNIIDSAKLIHNKYGDKVPNTMEELLTLPGVARKTANIVLSNAFGKIEGVAVDTHVKRLSYRLGLTKYDNPEKIEKDLMGLFGRADWFAISNLLIEHGRRICKAQRPDCQNCFLSDICPKVGVPDRLKGTLPLSGN